MNRPDIAQEIKNLNWHLDNDIMSGAERQVCVDAIDLLRNLAFTHMETDHDNKG